MMTQKKKKKGACVRVRQRQFFLPDNRQLRNSELGSVL